MLKHDGWGLCGLEKLTKTLPTAAGGSRIWI